MADMALIGPIWQYCLAGGFHAITDKILRNIDLESLKKSFLLLCRSCSNFQFCLKSSQDTVSMNLQYSVTNHGSSGHVYNFYIAQGIYGALQTS